eukprot:EG_transcript_5971
MCPTPTPHGLSVPEATVADLFEWADRTLLGQGAFADVFAARRRDNGVQYAVKQVYKARLENERHWQWLCHEVAVSQHVHHRGCIVCHDAFQDEQAVYLQLDLVPGGDLCTLLQRAGPLTEATVARFTRQILETLLYLHDERGIAHLDLKPDNLLCTTADVDTAEVRIGDFGFAKIFGRPGSSLVAGDPEHDESFLVSPKGTYGYMCPELLRHMLEHQMEPRVTTRPEIQKMDVYSLGVVVHILLCGAFPHAVRQPRRHHLRSMRFGPDFRLPVWGTLSSHARQFCRALLESDVARRPLVSEALAHPWLAHAAREPLQPAAPFAAVAHGPQALQLQVCLRRHEAELDAQGYEPRREDVAAAVNAPCPLGPVVTPAELRVLEVVPRLQRPVVRLKPLGDRFHARRLQRSS